MAVDLHEVCDGIGWRTFGFVRVTGDADLHEVSAIVMTLADLWTETVDREVIGPHLTVCAREYFFLCFDVIYQPRSKLQPNLFCAAGSTAHRNLIHC